MKDMTTVVAHFFLCGGVFYTAAQSKQPYTSAHDIHHNQCSNIILQAKITGLQSPLGTQLYLLCTPSPCLAINWVINLEGLDLLPYAMSAGQLSPFLKLNVRCDNKIGM